MTRLVAGLLKPDEGKVWLQGKEVTSPRATVGMAFQNPVLLEWRSILKNVMLPLEIVPNNLDQAAREARARDLLKLVGLAGFEDKRPSELSGGMRQRASLCRALVHRPEVLILDEPFGALDAFTREDLWMTMHRLREEEPFTGVLITHDLRESIFLADEVIVLSGRWQRCIQRPCCNTARVRSSALHAGSHRHAEHPARGNQGAREGEGGMRQAFVPILAMIIFLLFWKGWSGYGWPNYKWPRRDLWPAFWRFKGLFFVYGWETLWRTVVGLLIAIGVGVILGTVMGSRKSCERGCIRCWSASTRYRRPPWCRSSR